MDAASPAVNSSESPGRKNPISRPVSAKMIANSPSAPQLDSSEDGLSTFTASTAGLATS